MMIGKYKNGNVNKNLKSEATRGYQSVMDEVALVKYKNGLGS